MLNFKRQVIGIPEEKREKALKLVLANTVHENCAKTTVKQIQKLAGSLNFLCLKMFAQFLQENVHLIVKPVPFLNRLNIDSDQIKMYGNASGASNKALGCVFGNEWFYAKWSDTTLFDNGYKPNIALLELTVITVGFIYRLPALLEKQ